MVRSALEGIRRRPSLYLGDVGANGIHQLLFQVLEDMLLEFPFGPIRAIKITLSGTNSIEIKCDDDGIPVAYPSSHPGFALESYFTQFWVPGPNAPMGFHLISALSDPLVVQIARDGFLWEQNFAKGAVTGKLLRLRPLTQNESFGTTLRFVPDATIFPDAMFDYDKIATRCRELVYLFGDVRILVRNRCDFSRGADILLYTTEGIRPFADEMHSATRRLYPPMYANHALPHLKPDWGRNPEGSHRTRIEILFQYLDSNQPYGVFYCNGRITENGGSYLPKMWDTLEREMNRQWIRIAHASPRHMTSGVWRKGLLTLVNIIYPHAQFQDISMNSLISPEIIPVVAMVTKDAVGKFAGEYPDHMLNMMYSKGR